MIQRITSTVRQSGTTRRAAKRQEQRDREAEDKRRRELKRTLLTVADHVAYGLGERLLPPLREIVVDYLTPSACFFERPPLHPRSAGLSPMGRFQAVYDRENATFFEQFFTWTQAWCGEYQMIDFDTCVVRAAWAGHAEITCDRCLERMHDQCQSGATPLRLTHCRRSACKWLRPGEVISRVGFMASESADPFGGWRFAGLRLPLEDDGPRVRFHTSYECAELAGDADCLPYYMI